MPEDQASTPTDTSNRPRKPNNQYVMSLRDISSGAVQQILTECPDLAAENGVQNMLQHYRIQLIDCQTTPTHRHTL